MNLTAVAKEFGLSAERFLQLYRQNPGLSRLPGQLPRREFSEDQDHDIDLGLNLDALRKSCAWKRIKRAACFQGQCPAEFVTRSILEIIRTLEADMILTPRTGEAICDIAELEQFVKSES